MNLTCDLCQLESFTYKHNFVKIVVFGNTQIAIKKKYLEPNILHNNRLQNTNNVSLHCNKLYKFQFQIKPIQDFLWVIWKLLLEWHDTKDELWTFWAWEICDAVVTVPLCTACISQLCCSIAVCTVTDHDMMEKPLKLDIPVCLVINDHHEHSVTTSPSHQTSSVT